MVEIQVADEAKIYDDMDIVRHKVHLGWRSIISVHVCSA